MTTPAQSQRRSRREWAARLRPFTGGKCVMTACKIPAGAGEVVR